jgi:hypothetical protein
MLRLSIDAALAGINNVATVASSSGQRAYVDVGTRFVLVAGESSGSGVTAPKST